MKRIVLLVLLLPVCLGLRAQMLGGHVTDAATGLPVPCATLSEGSYVMDPDRPYVEAVVGIHNIFKLLHVEYVRRLNYLDLPTAHRWGLRYTMRMTF